MKKLILTSTLLYSLNSFATGGMYCSGIDSTQDKQTDITFNVGTSRVIGNPLLGNIQMTAGNKSFVIEKDRITNYLNYKNEIRIIALDEDFNEIEFYFEYNYKKEIGSLSYRTKNTNLKSKNIKCDFE